MIKIDKDKYPPEVRFTRANHPHRGQIKFRVALWKTLEDFRNNPAVFNSGDYSFVYDFGSEQYREALISCQGRKCCYCEKAINNGAIEHYRPQKAWQQQKGNPIVRPGYYWLAYSWSNFLISCSDCNDQSQKGNLFPVNGTRAVNPAASLSVELPQIINPAEEEPTFYISFNQDIPVGVDAGGRGNWNIETFKLKDRADLKSARSDKWAIIRYARDIAALMAPVGPFTQKRIDDAKVVFSNSQKKKEPFSGMIIENVRKGLL